MIEISGDYIIVLPDNIEWSEAPRGMPTGYEQAMIKGNPRVREVFTFRAKIQANWKAMPHFHPADEHITILEGSGYIGFGEEYNEEIAVEMPKGAFITVKAGSVHYFFTRGLCVIQVHGMGPQKITYINIDDDPRNSAMLSK